jgi:hypothetical protein
MTVAAAWRGRRPAPAPAAAGGPVAVRAQELGKR